MSDIIAQKVPPAAVDIEKSILASGLIDESVLDEMMESVIEDDFYSPATRAIFLAMKELYQTAHAVDVGLLANKLRDQRIFDKIGAEGLIGELLTSVATTQRIEPYAEVLKEKRMLRELIQASHLITNGCYAAQVNAKQVIDMAEQKIFSLAEDTMKFKPHLMKSLLGNTFKTMANMANSGGVTGLRTGFTMLDKYTTGFHPGELIVIAARPGMGKTAFALSLLANVGLRYDTTLPVVLFSVEMPKEQLAQRLLCSESKVDLQRIRGGELIEADHALLNNAAGRLSQSKIYIDDSPTLNLMDVRAKARRIKSQEGKLGLIIIDYLQLMHGVEKTESRQIEIASISRGLKSLAKELHVPVIALSQLSRAVEQRAGKNAKPQLSDLRESGAIEQDADSVLFIHREGDRVRKEFGADSSEYKAVKNMAELIIGKQRNGPLEDVPLTFIGEYTRFDNLEERFDAPDGFYEQDQGRQGERDMW